MSAPFIADATLSKSRTSPSTNLRFGWFLNVWASSELRERLSNAVTLFFSMSRPASVDPMNPAPPVMKMFLPSIISFFDFGVMRRRRVQMHDRPILPDGDGRYDYHW